MSDERNANAKIGVEIAGLKEINRAITAISQMTDGVAKDAKEWTRLETVLSKVASSLKEVQAAATAAKAQSVAVSKLSGSFGEITDASKLVKSSGFANWSDQKLKAYQEIERAEAAAYKENEARAKKQTAAQAAELAKQVKQQEQATAQAARVQTQAQAQILAAEKKANQERAREAARSQRQQEQSARAQLKYAKESSAAGSSYGKSKNIYDDGGQVISQRYALYDVAATWGAISTATLAAGVSILKVGMDYETAFAQVRRTTGVEGDAAAELSRTLMEMSNDLPSTFADLSAIASLGGQLGVRGASGIRDFTETVAKLTATTDLSADAAGTALGRFQALLGVTSSEFDNVGSSILKVGVNSVATETQIVAVSNNIASMGSFAGLTADQVIGLSGALASVGVQPELSRGTITRTFTLMSSAVAAGGENLQRFADISGVTANQFASAWGTDQFAGTFEKFLAGLGSTDNAEAALRALGITASRDVPTLMKLAQSGEVVSSAFDNAKTGFDDTTTLTKQYGIIADTTAAKLTMLGNAMKGLFAAGSEGSLGPLGEILDIIHGLVVGLQALAQTDGGQAVIGIAVAVSLLVGALTAYRAAQALALASMQAMQTASLTLGDSVHKANGSLKSAPALFTQMALGSQRATAYLEAYNATATKTSPALTKVKGAMNGLAAASKGLMASLGWTALLGAAVATFSYFSNRSADAKQKVEDFTAALIESNGALTENIRLLAFEDLKADGFVDVAKQMGVSLDDLVTASLDPTSAAYTRVSATMDDYVQKQLEIAKSSPQGGFDDAHAYMKAQEDQMRLLDALGGTYRDLEKSRSDYNDKVAAGVIEENKAGEVTSDYSDDIADVATALSEGVNSTANMQNALFDLGGSLQANGNSFSAYTEGGRANISALQQTISAMVTEAGGNSATLATLLSGLMSSLASYGVDSVNELAYVSNMINYFSKGATLDQASVANAANMAGYALGGGYAAGANKARSSSSKAAKEVRTLSDYISDLEGVAKDAFDFRWDLTKAVDSVSESWRAFTEYTDEASQSVSDAQSNISELYATLQQLSSDRDILTFQLAIAQDYGDSLRANDILAELAQNSVDAQDAQKDLASENKTLAKSQASLTPDLESNTQASAEQRDMALSLLEAYQDQIMALANTGMSQAQLAQRVAQLKQQFMQQLTQLGYNSASVSKYAATFDDLALAVSKVPRNITVSADTDPAQRAINEFLAKNQNNTINMGVSGDGYNAGLAQGNEYGKGWALGAMNNKQVLVRKDASIPGGMVYHYYNQSAEWFANGGYTGRGGKYDPAGIVHKGEFVVPKEMVNQSTGLPYANALGSMLPTYSTATTNNNYYSGGYVSGASTPQVQLVELMPSQVQQIVNAVSTEMRVDGRVLASTVGSSNTQQSRRGNG